MTKNEQISKTLAETRIKRQSQICKVYQFKIDESHLNSSQKEALKMFFVEAKWLYNYFLNKNEIFNQDYKISQIQSYDKDKNLVEHNLQFLPAKSKQIILQELKQNIFNLSKSKKKGSSVGRLNFKSNFNSIDFNQYGNSHKIIGNKFKLQGIKKLIPVFGLEQLSENKEYANCKLIKKPSGYYITLTTFEYKKPKLQGDKKQDVGIDFGIKNNIVTSEGKTYNIYIEETERLKRLQAKMTNQKKGSNNRYKTRILIQKEYEKITNRKLDAANKIVSEILNTHDQVYIQDENLKGWKEGWFGKQVQHSALGLIKSKLRQSKSVKMIDKFFPTTKMCYQCGKINEIELSERTYRCDCGLEEDRDIKAAKTILNVGIINNKYTPTEYRVEPVNFKQEDAESLVRH